MCGDSCKSLKIWYFEVLKLALFANGPGDLGSITGCVMPKTLKMVFDTYLLNTQQYKVHIKGKVEQSSGHPWLGSPTLLLLNYVIIILILSKVCKVCDLCRGWPKGTLFNSYYTKV